MFADDYDEGFAARHRSQTQVLHRQNAFQRRVQSNHRRVGEHVLSHCLSITFDSWCFDRSFLIQNGMIFISRDFYSDFCSLHDKYASIYPLLNRARHHLEHVEQNLTKHSDEDIKQVKKIKF